MKKSTLTIIHIVVAVLAIMFGVSKLNGQGYPNAVKSVEMVPYRLTPTYDGQCYIDIEIIEPIRFNNMVERHSDEVREILIDRIVFEITNPYSQNELFSIDDKYYYVIRLPYTGELWHTSY